MQIPLHVLQTIFVQPIEAHAGPARSDGDPPAMRQLMQALAYNLGMRGANERITPAAHNTLQGVFRIRMFHKMPQDGSHGLLHITGCALFRHAVPYLF